MTSDSNADLDEVPRPQVEVFDHTLMWPVLLHDTRTDSQRKPKSGRAKLEEYRQEIESTGVWKRVDTAKDENFCQPYNEVVYFHPFARKFLYDRPDGFNVDDPEFNEGVWQFERNDIVGVTVTLGNDVKITLAVSKVQLFLFDTFVAVAVIRLTNANSWSDDPETKSPRLNRDDKALRDRLSAEDQEQLGPIDLDVVLAFQEVFRRCYPPFWYDDGSAGLCPHSVDWIMDKSTTTSEKQISSDYREQTKFRDFVSRNVQSPVVQHFQFVMAPLVPYRRKHEGIQQRWLAYRQILDERIPVMSYVAVDRTDRMREADFFRLTFCDSPGNHPGVFPYSIGSPDVKNFPGDFVYDRFWGQKFREEVGGKWLKEQREGASEWTRYLCCGFGFVAVGSQSSWMFRELIRKHMQHHYFKLGLIAHFGRASLLAFDDRLAYAVQGRTSGDSWLSCVNAETTFRRKVREIEDDFVTFRTRYWFAEVSNHLQAREMFDWWGRHLEVDSLFKQVEGKIHTVNEVLERQDTQELNQKVERLTTWGISIALASLGAAIFTIAQTAAEIKFESRPFKWIAGITLFASLLAITVVILNDLGKCIEKRIKRDRK